MSLPCFIGKILDNKIIIEGQEYHHAINVKRLKIDDKIEVNNLNGNYLIGTISKIEKKYFIATIDRTIEKALPHINVTLYQCLPNKLSVIDELIEPISQLNVATFVPTISDFSRLKLKDIQKKMLKWEKIAVQSLKQCKRLYPLTIQNPQKLPNIDSKESLKIVFYENEKNKTLKDLPVKNIESVAVAIGPEGGFNENEITVLQKKGFVALSLSTNILKAEVATIAALAQIELIFR
ncbi:Ribosomal RNA small subunit methyltransferase E [Desulfurella amilsii]|uniref:Ribosomal RNA small subunit methyltransferase E n=1 Tax=Desulfurella amilsii TaxID=1562698 RepID=A0A1X4XVP6_9BACT|nr:RsmE family RNA methyltransferase [Desulfurella amilsii]OSS41609.1 Ribosomal RNA small subunit methyltransferase E [Desulfurella amilsii]